MNLPALDSRDGYHTPNRIEEQKQWNGSYTVMENVVMLAVIIVACFMAMMALAQNVNRTFQTVGSQLTR